MIQRSTSTSHSPRAGNDLQLQQRGESSAVSIQPVIRTTTFRFCSLPSRAGNKLKLHERGKKRPFYRLSRAGDDLELQQRREPAGVPVQPGVQLGRARNLAGDDDSLPDVVLQQPEVEPGVAHKQRHVGGQRGSNPEGDAGVGVQVAHHGLQEVALVPAMAGSGEGGLVGGALLALDQVPAATTTAATSLSCGS